ncbi:hypothetical protein NKF06_11550 [Haloferax sp. AB510]|uniref:hypothetical protein n=1 Tax=Haloferax sp. AB510 TaxID=2934172 RepID=UPI00209C31A8|nr:hypothetical protein [Haloferax sp. AB510]MCO8267205.1 hypothetical protein [Haloferax sp. AB510]
MLYDDHSRFIDQAMPVGDIMRSINSGYRVAYEFDRDDWAEGNKFLDGLKGGHRSEWGIDLTRVDSGGSVWGDKISTLQEHILHHIISQSKKHGGEISRFLNEREGDNIDTHKMEVYRNISNAWRDEFALNDPVDGSEDDRMRTTEWRIAICYYAIYKSISAILRIKFNKLPKNHTELWTLNQKQLLDRFGTKLYPFPFLNFPHQTDWSENKIYQWTVPYPMPEEKFEQQQQTQSGYAEHNLEYILDTADSIPDFNRNHVYSLFDLLKELRHWANYWHGGIFSRLYGQGYKQAIDDALRLLTYTGLATAEVAVITAFGLDELKKMHEEYSHSCELGMMPESYNLSDHRVGIYERAYN